MLKKILLLVVVCVLFRNGYCDIRTTSEKKCILPLPKLTFFAPLVFTSDGKIKNTIGELDSANDPLRVEVSDGENIILSCAPGYLKSFFKKTYIEAKCNGVKGKLEINGATQDYLKDLPCELRSIEEVHRPVSGCDANGVSSVKYGFTHPLTNDSFVLGEVCYDEQKGKTIFVHFKGQQAQPNTDLNAIALEVESKNFFTIDPDLTRYKIEFLMASRLDTLNDRLKTVLNSESTLPSLVQRHYVDTTLIGNKQFYNVIKLAWNFFMDYNSEDASNDKTLVSPLSVLQQDISNLNKKYDLYIGTHGVLSINKPSGGKSEIYLKDDKFPVPKYIWLVVKSEDKVVAFIVPNEPITKSANSAEPSICTNKCDQIKWLHTLNTFNIIADKIITCCEYNDFKNKVSEMPKLEGSFSLLV